MKIEFYVYVLGEVFKLKLSAVIYQMPIMSVTLNDKIKKFMYPFVKSYYNDAEKNILITIK